MNFKFTYNNTKYRFVSIWNKKWINGFFLKKNKFYLNESSTCLNYSQQCFEGLKCSFFKKKCFLFRIEKNSFRIQKSCKKILIPIISIFFFLKIIKILILLNWSFVPNINIGFLYIRPLFLGISSNLGVKTSKKFIFLIFVSPIFIKNDFKNFLIILNKERVINSLGEFKLGSNYIFHICNNYSSKKKGFNDIIYVKNNFFEEIGTSNILFLKNNKIISSFNKNILPGITKLSIIYLIKKKFIFKNKMLNFNEVSNIKSIIYCGTAIFIKNVKTILFKNKILKYKKCFFYNFLINIIKLIYKTKIKIKNWFIRVNNNWI